MVRENRSPKRLLAGLVTLCVVALLVVATAAGPTAAAPRLFVSDASKDATTILVGESVNVTATVKNTGDDGGAIDIKFKANGTTKATERVVVDADSQKKVTRALTFDEPGTYRISVHNPDRSAGRVRVKRAIASVVSEDAGSRAIEIRAGAVPTTEPYTVGMPAATDRSFAVESWTVDAANATFTQRVTEYTDTDALGVSLPSDDVATVFGVVAVGSTGGVEPASMRLALNRSTLRTAGLDATDVRIYHRENGTWVASETSVVDERPGRVVYEASANGSSTFALGRMEPSFSVTRTSVVSTDRGDTQRIVLEGAVRNSGAVAGSYDAQLRLNDAVVNETSITVPAGSERTIRLSTVVDTPGEYKVSLNDQSAGTLRIDPSDVATPTEGETVTEPTEATETATTDGSEPVDDDGFGALPETVLGINTVFVVGGVAVALLVFGGIIAVLRRGGGGRGSSDFEL